jgi:hypothetical protein
MKQTKQTKLSYDNKKLIKWLNDDPYREAELILLVPIKQSTLSRIKSGSYIPSKRLANAINAIIKLRTNSL